MIILCPILRVFGLILGLAASILLIVVPNLFAKEYIVSPDLIVVLEYPLI